MTPADPLIVNRYRLIETTGQGAYGTVNIAWDTRLQRRVAIKRIPLSVSETELPGIQEARTAALLNDAHIVTLHDFQVTGTEALIIMEYVDGPTLGDLLRESPQLLSLDVITAIVSDIAAALSYAHENQVLHLDIKPDNILIDHQGNIKVSDFGLSQLSGITGFNEPQGGTLGYMPPEQLLQQSIDPRTDLWALGALFYQLLTGQTPFAAATLQESLDRIVNQPLPLPTAFDPQLDPYIDELLIKALMADKALRFDSVSQFISQISPYLGNARKGRKELKYLVNFRDLDELELSDTWHQEDLPPAPYNEQSGPTIPHPPLWQRMPQRLQGFLSHLAAALACGSFACIGLSGFGLLDSSILQTNLQLGLLIGVIALTALSAALAPRLGSAVASVIFIAGLLARSLWGVAIVVGVLLVLWWLFCGRKSNTQSTLVMLTPLFGAAWLGLALPMLTGYFLRPKQAIFPACVQATLLLVMAGITGAPTLAHTGFVIPNQAAFQGALPWAFTSATSSGFTSPFFGISNASAASEAASVATTWFGGGLVQLATNPTTWVMLAAVIVAAIAAAMLTGRSTRWAALIGTLVASALLVLGIICPLLVPSLLVRPTDLMLNGVGLSLSFILLLLLSLMGVSTRKAQGGAG